MPVEYKNPLESGDIPPISMFYGLIVYMHFKDNKQHKLPHIHVKYQNDEVIVQIPEGTVLEGKSRLPE